MKHALEGGNKVYDRYNALSRMELALEQRLGSIETIISADTCYALKVRYPGDKLTLAPGLFLHMDP